MGAPCLDMGALPVCPGRATWAHLEDAAVRIEVKRGGEVGAPGGDHFGPLRRVVGRTLRNRSRATAYVSSMRSCTSRKPMGSEMITSTWRRTSGHEEGRRRLARSVGGGEKEARSQCMRRGEGGLARSTARTLPLPHCVRRRAWNGRHKGPGAPDRTCSGSEISSSLPWMTVTLSAHPLAATSARATLRVGGNRCQQRLLASNLQPPGAHRNTHLRGLASLDRIHLLSPGLHSEEREDPCACAHV